MLVGILPCDGSSLIQVWRARHQLESDPKVNCALLPKSYNFLPNVRHRAENRLCLGPTAWALAASIRSITQVTDIKLNTVGPGS